MIDIFCAQDLTTLIKSFTPNTLIASYFQPRDRSTLPVVKYVYQLVEDGWRNTDPERQGWRYSVQQMVNGMLYREYTQPQHCIIRPGWDKEQIVIDDNILLDNITKGR